MEGTVSGCRPCLHDILSCGGLLPTLSGRVQNSVHTYTDVFLDICETSTISIITLIITPVTKSHDPLNVGCKVKPQSPPQVKREFQFLGPSRGLCTLIASPQGAPWQHILPG